MCGRLWIKITLGLEKFLIDNNIHYNRGDGYLYLPDFPELWNLPPTSQAPVILNTDHGLRMEMMRWQLHPYWSPDAPTYSNKTFNARIETVLTLRSFRVPVRERRAIVPAAGFIEWQRAGDIKQPYYIDAGDEPLLLAGIWDNWRGEVQSFAVITQAANDDFAWLHDRMPLSLTPDQALRWLDPTANVESLLGEFRGKSLKLYPRKVSTKVNNARNKEPLEFIA